MKDSESSLDRLLRTAAAHGRPEPDREPPYGFTTRVIAEWLSARPGSARGMLELLWLRRAFLCSLVVMSLAAGWEWKQEAAAPSDEMAVTSYDAAAVELQ